MKQWTKGWRLVVLVGMVPFLMILSTLGSSLFIGNFTEAGQFGDSFGVTNSLFSGLAFIGLVVAIHLQREDIKKQSDQLELQREELVLTRKELRRAAVAQEESREAVARQSLLQAKAAHLQAMGLYFSTRLSEGGPDSDRRGWILDFAHSLDYFKKYMDRFEEDEMETGADDPKT